jgi:hypothetical protein
MFADFLVVEWSPTTFPLAAPAWEDITQYVTSVTASRGFGSLIDTYSNGTATVVANNGAGVTDPGWLDASSVTKWVRMRVRHTGSAWYVFSGYVGRTVHGWGEAPQRRTVTFQLVDLFQLLGPSTVDNVDTYFGGTPIGEVFQAEYSNQSGWVTNGGPLDVATWVFGQLGVALTSTDGHCHECLFVPSNLRGPALSTLATYLEAGLERVEIAADGGAYLRGRWDATIAYTASPTSPVFSDDLTVNSTAFNYRRGTLDVAALDRDFYNTAVVDGVEGGPFTQTRNTHADFPVAAYTRTSTPIADANWSRGTAEAVAIMSSGFDTFPARIECVLGGPQATSVDATHPALANVLGVATVVQNHAATGPYSWPVATTRITFDINQQAGFKATFDFTNLGFAQLDNFGGGLYQLGVSTLGAGRIFGP